jgi:hypothetical protein
MVIARGRQEYERVLTDPTQMAREGFEPLLGLPHWAYMRKTGRFYEYEVGISEWAGCNKAGWMREDEAG